MRIFGAMGKVVGQAKQMAVSLLKGVSLLLALQSVVIT